MRAAVCHPLGDDIRCVVVASTLGQLPDLGGARVVGGLRVLFEERNAPTLLVADSLTRTVAPIPSQRLAYFLNTFHWKIPLNTQVKSQPLRTATATSV